MGRILYNIGDDEGARTEFEACRDVAANLRTADAHDARGWDLLCQADAGLGHLAARGAGAGSDRRV